MSKRFNDYTDAELVGITNEQFNDAVRIEAIERGVKPPIALSDAIKQIEFVGYSKPANAVKVFCLKAGYHRCDVGWLDESKALAALEGAVHIDIAYPSGRAQPVIKTSDVLIETVLIGVSHYDVARVKLEESLDDKESAEFTAIKNECIEKLGRVRQEAYNIKVRREKRSEYLRLAGGDEAIAARFWGRAEGSAWPTAEEVAPKA